MTPAPALSRSPRIASQHASRPLPIPSLSSLSAPPGEIFSLTGAASSRMPLSASWEPLSLFLHSPRPAPRSLFRSSSLLPSRARLFEVPRVGVPQNILSHPSFVKLYLLFFCKKISAFFLPSLYKRYTKSQISPPNPPPGQIMAYSLPGNASFSSEMKQSLPKVCSFWPGM